MGLSNCYLIRASFLIVLCSELCRSDDVQHFYVASYVEVMMFNTFT